MTELLQMPSARLPRGLLLFAVAACGAVFLTVLALVHPALALTPVALGVAIPATIWLFQRPLLNLCVVLGGFVLIANYTAGIGLGEVIYGVYFALFIGHWFGTRVALYHAPEFTQTASKAMLLFLITATVMMLPAVLFYEVAPLDAVREWRMIFMLALFFPVREAVVRYKYAIPAVGVTIALVWMFIALRNLLDYRALLLNAVYEYQIGRGRVMSNDNVLMVSSVCLATWAMFATRWHARIVLGIGWGLCFAALILTHSRSYWVAFAFGMGLLFLLSPATVRLRILGAVGLGSLVLVFLGGLFFADTTRTVVAGLINRVASIGDAVTLDISFVSRLYEARGVLARVPESPFFGHGPGAVFTFSNVIDRVTGESSFIHNGYVALLFKYGVWGLGLALTLWLGSIWNGIRAFRMQGVQLSVRLAGLAAALCLCGYLLSALAAPPFMIDDNTFNLGLLTGVATGAFARAQRETGART